MLWGRLEGTLNLEYHERKQFLSLYSMAQFACFIWGDLRYV